MLVTLKEILKIAEARKCALGSFNTPSLTSLRAVIAAAEELNEPVIIMHAQLHEDMGICKLDEIGPIMLFMADRAKVPVCVHLDHGTDFDYVKRGLDIGFTSIMYDGSEHGEKMNFVNTSIVVEMAARTGASVEGEIGSMGEREDGTKIVREDTADDESIYTDPETAKLFVEETGIDALACAFGTVHGLYVKEPKLDFERLAKIKELVDVPLVVHGGSGMSDEDTREIIRLGIRKVNYYTYMAKAGANAIMETEKKIYLHDMELAAMEGIKQDVQRAIKLYTAEV